MKKLIAVAAIIFVIGGFVVFHNIHQTAEQPPIDTNIPAASSSPSTSANYKDGSYTGNVSSASMYGDVQVKAIISGGKITDIQFLQLPDAPGHTTEVSTVSSPILKQEAIQAQSAHVNLVSGATQTSQGFIDSLQSALDQAKI